MDLLTLKSNKGARHKRKRVGRGNGSGLGTYSGRGMNGQNARSGGNRRPGFEGGQTSFIQRMPKLRGFKNPNYVTYQVVNVKDLEVFDNGATVDRDALIKKGLVAKKTLPVKILGDGELSKKLTIKADAVTKSAEAKIKKAGSTIEVPAPKKVEKPKKEKTKNADKAETPAKEPKAEAPAEKPKKKPKAEKEEKKS